MSLRIVIAGTDTGLGKTVLSAALVAALDGCYWKPVQAGIEGGTDSARVQHLAGLPPDRILPEAYRLATPCSPHRAAEIDGVAIEPSRLAPPQTERPLVIETAGGLMVPLTHARLQIDVLAGWHIPVVLAARTTLGTINHTLLSLEAMRRRQIPIVGVAFIGDENPDSERAIAEIGNVKRLGRLPMLARLEPATLSDAFRAAFAIDEIRAGGTAS